MANHLLLQRARIRERQSRIRGRLTCAVILVSQSLSRTPDLPTGMNRKSTSLPLAKRLLERAGHRVPVVDVTGEDPNAIRRALRAAQRAPGMDAVFFLGGTGITQGDHTVEALRPLFAKELPGFGELFRARAVERIGPAGMMSRATAGVVGPHLVFALPGSPDAVATGIRLVLPVLSLMLDAARRT